MKKAFMPSVLNFLVVIDTVSEVGAAAKRGPAGAAVGAAIGVACCTTSEPSCQDRVILAVLASEGVPEPKHPILNR